MDPFNTDSCSKITISVSIFIVAVLLFIVIANNMLDNSGVAAFDISLSSYLHVQATPPLTTLIEVVTDLHRPVSILLLSLPVAIFLVRTRGFRWLVFLALAIPGGSLLNVGLKLLFQRARPVFEIPLMSVDSYSFPSGHVLGSTVFYGLLVLLVFAKTADWRKRGLALAGTALMVSLVAFSRIYLGVHYLSDTLAAVMEGVAWLALCHVIVFGTEHKRTMSPE